MPHSGPKQSWKVPIIFAVLTAILTACGAGAPQGQAQGDTLGLVALPAPSSQILRAQDNTSVVRITPAEGATGVATSAGLQLEFAQAINRSSVETAFALFPGKYDPSVNPATFTKLGLTSMCNGRWRVRNPNTSPISFAWDAYGTTERGVGVVPGNTDVFFSSSLSKTVRVFVGGVQQNVKASNPAVCTSSDFSFLWQSNDQQARIQPTRALEANTDYTVVLSTRGTLASGTILLTAPLVSRFKTSAASTGLQINSFTVTSGSVQQARPFQTGWSIGGTATGRLTCTLSFGEGTPIVQLPNCPIQNGSFSHIYRTTGAQTATLSVRDEAGQQASASLPISVGELNASVVNFTDADVQAAWQRVTSSSQVITLGLRFNTSQGQAIRSGDGTYLFIVPEPLGSRSPYQSVLNVVGVLGSQVLTHYRLASDFVRDQLDISDVLLGGSTRIPQMSTKTPADVQGLMGAVIATPLYDTTSGLGGLSRTGLFSTQSTTCVTDCQGALIRYRYAFELAKIGLSFLSTDLFAISRDYFFAIGGDLAALAGGVWSSYSRIVNNVGAAIPFFAISTGIAAVQTYNLAVSCIQSNDPGYTSGKAIIAILSPPLPVSLQVFVQSLPERLNVGTGNLNSETPEAILTNAVPNAVGIFEIFSDRTVLPNSPKVDLATQTISAAYASTANPPICPSPIIIQ